MQLRTLIVSYLPDAKPCRHWNRFGTTYIHPRISKKPSIPPAESIAGTACEIDSTKYSHLNTTNRLLCMTTNHVVVPRWCVSAWGKQARHYAFMRFRVIMCLHAYHMGSACLALSLACSARWHGLTRQPRSSQNLFGMQCFAGSTSTWNFLNWYRIKQAFLFRFCLCMT